MTTALAGLSSFDLRFLELDVLARDRVVFAEGHLLGDVPRILLGDVEEAGVGGADELDLDGGRLGHDSLSKSGCRKTKSGVPRRSDAPPPLPPERRYVKAARLNLPVTISAHRPFRT